MNKVYNVVWSEEHQTWVVCSELDKRGRKKSAGTKIVRAAKLAATLAVAGAGAVMAPAYAQSVCNDTSGTGAAGTSVASGGSCAIPVYQVDTHDNKVGQALVRNGDSVTITAASVGTQLVPQAPNPASSVGLYPHEVFTDPSHAATLERERLLSGSQGAATTVVDPDTGSNQTVNYYNAIGGPKIREIPINVATNGDVLVDMRLGTATGAGSTLRVNLGDDTQGSGAAMNVTPSAHIAAKQSHLVQAENGATVQWESKNGLIFESMTLAETTTTRTFSGVLKPKTVNLLGTSYTINSVADLRAFNTALVNAIGQPGFANPGETLQNAYNRRYNEAATVENVTLSQANPAPIYDDATKPVGERWVMTASGTNSTAVIKPGAVLEQRVPGGSGNRDSSGGGMLAENGGKVLVETGGSLSSHWNAMTVRGANSTGVNQGVISGGYFAGSNWDTSSPGEPPRGYVEGDAVIVKDSATFDNEGIINAAAFTYPLGDRTNYGVIVKDDAVATNKGGGIINVGVNIGIRSAVEGVYVGQNGTFNTEAGSEIYIGRAAQYQKNRRHPANW